MEQYYYTDGKERYGPFTLDQMRGRNVGPETLVWKEGMPDWVAAKNLSDLQSLFEAADSFPPPVAMPYSQPYQERPPKNWLIESILVTIFCCLPFGIVGIINATKVESLWNSGQKEASLKASQEAAKWIKYGVITGLVFMVLYFILFFFGIVAGLGSGLAQ
ncbi:MAG TPA: CD225/dispanin family protein [Saprospiraceae bacterium]|nr:CD225/dispanin family protein [Saprospiraceae bacterium]